MKQTLPEDAFDAENVQHIVINNCYGGFGLSDLAYEKLIEWGIPVRKYVNENRDEKTGLFIPEPANEGEVIFDRELTPPGECKITDLMRAQSRYWETWTEKQRSHHLLVRVVRELGTDANGDCAKLKIVDIPADVRWTIQEYDGKEHVAEQHRTWY